MGPWEWSTKKERVGRWRRAQRDGGDGVGAWGGCPRRGEERETWRWWWCSIGEQYWIYALPDVGVVHENKGFCSKGPSVKFGGRDGEEMVGEGETTRQDERRRGQGQGREVSREGRSDRTRLSPSDM